MKLAERKGISAPSFIPSDEKITLPQINSYEFIHEGSDAIKVMLFSMVLQGRGVQHNTSPMTKYVFRT